MIDLDTVRRWRESAGDPEKEVVEHEMRRRILELGAMVLAQVARIAELEDDLVRGMQEVKAHWQERVDADAAKIAELTLACDLGEVMLEDARARIVELEAAPRVEWSYELEKAPADTILLVVELDDYVLGIVRVYGPYRAWEDYESGDSLELVRCWAPFPAPPQKERA